MLIGSKVEMFNYGSKKLFEISDVYILMILQYFLYTVRWYNFMYNEML